MMKNGYLVLILLSLVLTAACSQDISALVASETATPTPVTQVLVVTPPGNVSTEEEIVITPTPEKTATPSPIQRSISDFASSTGLNQQVFLGLTGEDWINLGISLLIVLIGTILITRIVHALLRWIT
ncbi:MAG: hypothetical protein JJE12_11725, partial [Anaerolineales bacterium]|nr:hypothetical protein [Anaerolineales bacterium]